jgi:hypothetical protein
LVFANSWTASFIQETIMCSAVVFLFMLAALSFYAVLLFMVSISQFLCMFDFAVSVLIISASQSNMVAPHSVCTKKRVTLSDLVFVVGRYIRGHSQSKPSSTIREQCFAATECPQMD